MTRLYPQGFFLFLDPYILENFFPKIFRVAKKQCWLAKEPNCICMLDISRFTAL